MTATAEAKKSLGQPECEKRINMIQNQNIFFHSIKTDTIRHICMFISKFQWDAHWINTMHAYLSVMVTENCHKKNICNNRVINISICFLAFHMPNHWIDNEYKFLWLHRIQKSMVNAANQEIHTESERKQQQKIWFSRSWLFDGNSSNAIFWHIQKWFCRKTCLLTSTDSTICVKYHRCIHIIGFQYSYYEFHGAMLDFEMLKIAMWQFVTSNTMYGRVSVSICNRQWMFQADNRFFWIFSIRV